MPNVLKAIFGGDSMPFVREMQKMEAQAAITGSKVQRSLGSTLTNGRAPRDAAAEYAGFWKQALAERDKAETDLAVRQATRDNKARAIRRQRRGERISEWRAEMETMRNGPAGFQTGGVAARGVAGMGVGGFLKRSSVASGMFISVARDSAASLASGAPITQVVAQQAPQVLQALTYMKLGAIALRVSIVGIAAAITGKLIYSLAQSYIGTENLKKSFESLAMAVDNYRVKLQQANKEARLDADEAAAAARRKMDAANYDLDVGDAAAELDKEKARNYYLDMRARILGKQREESKLELKQSIEMLEIDKRRAEEKLKLAQSNLKHNSEVDEKQAAVDEINRKFKEAEEAGKQRLAEVDKAHPNKGPGFFHSKSDPEKVQARQEAIRQALNQNEQEMMSLRSQLSIAEKDLAEAKRQNGQADIDRAKAALEKIKNDIKEKDQDLKRPEQLTKLTFSASSQEKHGMFGVGYDAHLDVNKNIHAALLGIHATIKGAIGKHNSPTRARTVHFGGRRS